MDYINLGMIWFVAVSFGAMHAFDSDHVLTLTNVMPGRNSVSARLAYCLRWAIGHGLAVTTLGSAVLIFKTAIPYDISAIAEHLVGTILLLLGVTAFYQASHHVMLVRHGQYTNQQDMLKQSKPLHGWHQLQSVSIGFLHGTAGSAALLALVPLTQLHTVWQGLSFLLFFSMGVLVAMTLFGSLLGTMLQAILKRSAQSIFIIRMILAVPAIGIGLWMALPLS